MSKKLYRFHWDCGRQGDVEGVFVADDATISSAIGKTISFGEILGKHSDVYGVLEEKDIEALTDDATAIDVIEKYLDGGTGYNPLDYMGEED